MSQGYSFNRLKHFGIVFVIYIQWGKVDTITNVKQETHSQLARNDKTNHVQIVPYLLQLISIYLESK